MKKSTIIILDILDMIRWGAPCSLQADYPAADSEAGSLDATITPSENPSILSVLSPDNMSNFDNRVVDILLVAHKVAIIVIQRELTHGERKAHKKLGAAASVFFFFQVVSPMDADMRK